MVNVLPVLTFRSLNLIEKVVLHQLAIKERQSNSMGHASNVQIIEFPHMIKNIASYQHVLKEERKSLSMVNVNYARTI